MTGWQVRTARGIMFAQAVASLGIWVIQLLTTSVRLDHNQDVPGTVRLVLVVNPVLAILVAVAAAFLARRRWARGLAQFVEVLGVISAVISVTTGYYQALVAVALALGVLTLIARSTPKPAHA